MRLFQEERIHDYPGGFLISGPLSCGSQHLQRQGVLPAQILTRGREMCIVNGGHH